MFIETVEIFSFFVYFIPCGQKRHKRKNREIRKKGSMKSIDLDIILLCDLIIQRLLEFEYKVQLFWEGYKNYLVNVKTIRRMGMAQIFVAFSEKLNFNYGFLELGTNKEVYFKILPQTILRFCHFINDASCYVFFWNSAHAHSEQISAESSFVKNHWTISNKEADSWK